MAARHITESNRQSLENQSRAFSRVEIIGEDQWENRQPCKQGRRRIKDTDDGGGFLDGVFAWHVGCIGNQESDTDSE